MPLPAHIQFFLSVADGNKSLFDGLLFAKLTRGEGAVANFLDLVPERGDALWNKFTKWRAAENGRELLGFPDFVRWTLAEEKRLITRG